MNAHCNLIKEPEIVSMSSETTELRILFIMIVRYRELPRYSSRKHHQILRETKVSSTESIIILFEIDVSLIQPEVFKSYQRGGVVHRKILRGMLGCALI